MTPPVWLIARRSSSAKAVVAWVLRARGAFVIAGGRAAWPPPPRRAVWPGGRGAGAPDLRARGAQQRPQTRAILQIPRCRERLRDLTTHFVAFVRRHASNPPPGANFGNFPPPLAGELPSFGSRRPARTSYANPATLVQPLCTSVAQAAERGEIRDAESSQRERSGYPAPRNRSPSPGAWPNLGNLNPGVEKVAELRAAGVFEARRRESTAIPVPRGPPCASCLEVGRSSAPTLPANQRGVPAAADPPDYPQQPQRPAPRISHPRRIG